MLGPDVKPNFLDVLKAANKIRGQLIAQRQIVSDLALSADGKRVFFEYHEPGSERKHVIVDDVTAQSVLNPKKGR